MRVTVGSKNVSKVNAVRDTLRLYPMFENAEVVGVTVPVETYGHPKTLGETVEGAVERARQAFADCSYSFGLESGLLEVPQSKTGVMEVCACAIFDGARVSLGLSPAFEWPARVVELIVRGGRDASQAVREAGLTDHGKLGATEGGAIGLLTKGRLERKGLNVQAIIMALIHLENPKLYSD